MANFIKTPKIAEEKRPINQINLAKVLVILSDKDPLGLEFRYSTTIDDIKRAREGADDQTGEEGVKVAEWPKVIKLCKEALEQKTKDLMVAFWLVEAWINQYGLIGAVDGMRFINQLLPFIFEYLKEKNDKDSLEMEVSAIDWSNNKLSIPLSMIALSDEVTKDGTPYRVYDYYLITDPANKKKLKMEEGLHKNKSFTRESFDALAKSNPDSYNELIYNESELLRIEIQTLESYVEQYPWLDLGFDEPSDVYRLRQSILQTCDAVRYTVSLKGKIGITLEEQEPPEIVEEQLEGEAAIAEKIDTTVSAAAGVFQREDAYATLQKVYDFLRHAEPHSPVIRVLECVIRWGEKDLSGILEELSHKQKTIEELYFILGPVAEASAPSGQQYGGGHDMGYGSAPPMGGGYPPSGGGGYSPGGGHDPFGGGGGGFPPPGGHDPFGGGGGGFPPGYGG